MNDHAFGKTTEVLLDGTLAFTIDLSDPKSGFKFFHLIALDAPVTLTGVVPTWQLTDESPTVATRTIILAAAGIAQIATSVTLPVSGQLGGLQKATISAGSGKMLALFFRG